MGGGGLSISGVTDVETLMNKPSLIRLNEYECIKFPFQEARRRRAEQVEEEINLREVGGV